MQGLITLIMSSLYGVRIQKDTNESFYCISEIWTNTDYDENVLDYWKLSNGKSIVKMKKDDDLDNDCGMENILPSHVGAIITCNSKRIMINFIKR